MLVAALAAEWRCKTRVQTHAAQSKQGSKQQQPKLSARNAQLYELSDDDGWGVEVAPAGSSSSSSSAAKQPAKQRAGGAQPPAKKGELQWESTLSAHHQYNRERFC